MQVHHNFDLSNLNTLQLKSVAQNFTEVKSLEDLRELSQSTDFRSSHFKILGGGSNIVPPPFINGFVMKVANKGHELISETQDTWLIKVSAGEDWHHFVQWTLKNEFWGLENLSLIPGSAGAAPIQNIGAYGVEVKNFIHECHCIDLKSMQPQKISNSGCDFSYRNSTFKRFENSHLLIWEIVFRLPKKNILYTSYGDIQKELFNSNKPATPKNISEAVIKIRQSKLPDPAVIGNAGSFFKNPIVSSEKRSEIASRFPNLISYPTNENEYKLAAGWLIEQAGWKGKRLGSVGMFEKQALVLVNHGGATADDVWKTANQVSLDVFNIFGVQIEPEPIKW